MAKTKNKKQKTSIKQKIKNAIQKRRARRASKFIDQMGGLWGDSKTELKVPKVKKAKINAAAKPRRLAKTVTALNLRKSFKKSQPILRQIQFKKLLKANIQKNINTGNFKKAKELIPIYKRLISGKISPLQQRRLESKGVVGIYTIEKSKVGYTIAKVYNKFKLKKIMPNDLLTGQQFKFLKEFLGYSSRVLKTLKARQLVANTTPASVQKDLESAERDFKFNGNSWSGSADFDTVIMYMGGFAIAISKYPKEVQNLAQRYDVNLQELVKNYLPNFAD